MATSLSELLDLTQNKYSWLKGNNGHFAVTTYYSNSGEPTVVKTFTPSELAEVHPQLPVSLAKLIQWHRETHFSTIVLGHRVGALLSLIMDDVVHCTDVSGYDRVLQHIYDYMPDPENADIIVVGAMLVTVEKRNVDGVDIAFVINADTVDVRVPVEDLNQRYPGWAERWVIANTLEIRRDEFRRYVFPSNIVLAITPLSSEIEFNE